MTTGTRARRRDDVTARVLEIGRRHLTEQGAAALSLRAVARDLGMVSSAVYRYVANRDELLTLLVVDAYTELADEVDERLAAAGRAAWDTRILALGNAVRDWALREPARYALLYGSPVPGYEAPSELTTGPGTRVVLAILALVVEGVQAGDVTNGASLVPVPRPLRADLEQVLAQLDASVHPQVLARAVQLWAVLFGMVSLEVFGQFANTFIELNRLFEYQLRLAVGTVRG